MQWINKVSFDIWRWCHTPFQSYRPQLCNGSDKNRFKFHFLLRETHRAVCAIIDCKKKAVFERRGKKIEIIYRNCLPHHKKASTFINMHEAAQLHLIPMLLRYCQMSESLQRDEQCSSFHDMWCFHYDEQCLSLHAERLRFKVSTCFGHYLPIFRRHYMNAGLVTIVCSCRCGLVSGCGSLPKIATHHVTRHNTPIHNIFSTAPQLSISQNTLWTLPENGNVMPKHVGAIIHN
jgi:hypothetical protein